MKKASEGVKDAVDEITARDLWQEADQVREERLGIRKNIDDEKIIPVRKKDKPVIPPTQILRESSIREPGVKKEEALPIPGRRTRRMELGSDRPDQEYAPLGKQLSRDVQEGMSRTTKTIVGLLIVIAAIVGYSVISKKQSPSVQPQPEPKAVTKAPEQKAKPQVVLPPKKDSVIALPVVSSDSLLFTISAKDSVWVSVSPDVGKGFRGKLAKGETRRFSAKEKYFLFLGNQKSVTKTLDGKPISNLPTVAGSNLVVRNLVLTRDKVFGAPTEKKPESVKKSAQKAKEISKKKAPAPQKKITKTAKKKKVVVSPPIKGKIGTVKPQLPR